MLPLNPANHTASRILPNSAVLLVSELGIGMGHAKRLLVIGRALKSRGVRVAAAMRELWTCADEFQAADIPLLQAPVHRAVLPPGEFKIASYADMAAACGFGAVESLWPTILGWTALIDLVRPDLIIADYSPLAALAAFDRVPVVAIGDGFVLPPPHLSPMPLLRPDGADPADEGRLMANAALVLGQLGRRAPVRLGALVGGQAHVVCTYPELDIYGSSRDIQALGSLLPGIAPLSPAPTPRIFLYLSAAAPITQPILRAVAATSLPTEGYIRDAPEPLKLALRQQGFLLNDAPPPLPSVLARTSLVIHHGGIGTLETCVASGRRQFLAPSQFEQTLNVARCVAQDLAVSITRADTDTSLRDRIELLARGDFPPSRLADVMQDISQRPSDAALHAVLDACERLV